MRTLIGCFAVITCWGGADLRCQAVHAGNKQVRTSSVAARSGRCRHTVRLSIGPPAIKRNPTKHRALERLSDRDVLPHRPEPRPTPGPLRAPALGIQHGARDRQLTTVTENPVARN